MLVIFVFVTAELGGRLGRGVNARGDTDKNASTLATASLGLLALLIDFTYSIALARYDLRRQSVFEEANAIGSAVNCALMLPVAQKEPTLDLLRDYTRVRLNLGAPFDPARFARDVVTTGDLQAKLWKQAAAASAAQPQSLPVYQLLLAGLRRPPPSRAVAAS